MLPNPYGTGQHQLARHLAGYRPGPGGSVPPEPAASAAPPDVGAWRASDVLAERCGITVTAAGVEELAARGLIRAARKLRGVQLYSGEDLAAVDPAAVAGAQAASRRRWCSTDSLMLSARDPHRLLGLARIGWRSATAKATSGC
jgi:hypothetical protein